jgi:signal transduction histidine kinase/DNA-binding response OmpR family regulator
MLAHGPKSVPAADGSREAVQDAPHSKLPNWYVTYLILAVVNLCAISLGFWLNHHYVGLLDRSSQTYRIYADLLERTNNVGNFAIAAGLPAAAIFSSGDVAVESARLDEAVRQCREELIGLRAAIGALPAVFDKNKLDATLADIDRELDALLVETRLALNDYASNRFAEAGKHAAAKNEHSLRIFLHLMATARQIRQTQREILERQVGVARGNEHFSAALVVISALVIIAVFFHARRVRQAAVQSRLQRARMMRELGQARDLAERAASVKAQFLANMSHEIRTPLNGVLGTLDTLATTPLTDQQTNLLRTANTSADLLLSIIDDVLDFSKIEAGLLVIEAIPVNLLEVVNHVNSLFNVTAAQKGLQLQFKIPDRPMPLVISDSTRLTQVLSNLVGNALKFTRTGGVTVTLELLEEDGDLVRVKFSVRDTGIGIPADVQARLFAPFTQADGSTSRRFGGTGLGLAICKQLVTLLDKDSGEIGVSSAPEAGSTFHFTLRLRRVGEVAVETDLAPRDIAAQFSGRILIAEDNETNQQVIVTMLRSMGLETALAANGKEAVEAVQRERFDLILMDYHMPELDGCDAALRIRRHEQTQKLRSRTPIIAVTASVLREDRERCIAAGMNDFLAKPVRQRTLAAMLDKWLSARPRHNVEEPPAIQPESVADTPWSMLPSSVFDLEQLQEMRTIAGDTFEYLMEQFYASTLTGLAAMNSALANGDAQELRRAAHKLKGAAATLGAKTIAQRCTALEIIGKEQRLDAAAEHIRVLEQEYHEVRRHMSACTQRKAAPAA